jgi:hypothetical protein
MPLIVALVVLPLAWWWGIAIKWQYPNNHPLCHLCGQLSSCFFSTSLHSAALFQASILSASVAKFTGTRQTFQSPELPKHTFSHTKGSLQPDGLPLHI